MMNIALTDDLQRLLKKKVENGQFPNEEAVVEEALRLFLIGEPNFGQPPMGSSKKPPKDSDEDAQAWRGVYALEYPEEVLFTKPIDIRPEQLDNWPRKESDRVGALWRSFREPEVPGAAKAIVIRK